MPRAAGHRMGSEALACRRSASVAPTVKAEAPEATGVPLMTPVAGSSDRPRGSAPEMTPQVYGTLPPLAVRMAEQGADWIPVCRWEAGRSSRSGPAPRSR
jgi:hypothetical protein